MRHVPRRPNPINPERRLYILKKSVRETRMIGCAWRNWKHRHEWSRL